MQAISKTTHLLATEKPKYFIDLTDDAIPNGKRKYLSSTFYNIQKEVTKMKQTKITIRPLISLQHTLVPSAASETLDNNDKNKGDGSSTNNATIMNEAVIDSSNVLPLPPKGILKQVGQLGEGTYGVVVKVQDEDGRFFARKCFYQDAHPSDEEEDTLGTMTREISILNAFKGHPNILHCFANEIDRKKNQYSVVLELMDGDLHGLCKKSELKAIRMNNIRSMAYQILSALAFLHSEKIAHRDIKSQNILYRRKKDNTIELKLADFGLSRRLTGRCYTGSVVTVCYRPPELLLLSAGSDKEKEYGTEIDIWSAGMVITELILGWNFTMWKSGNELIQKLTKIFDLSQFPNANPNSSSSSVQVSPLGIQNFLKQAMVYTEKTNTFSNMMIDPQLLDLVDKLMKPNPFDRISAAQALKHPYFYAGTNNNQPQSASYNTTMAVIMDPLYNHNPSLNPSVLQQTAFAPRAQFLEFNNFDWTQKHPQISITDRKVVVEWLAEVAERYDCHIEVFSQSIEIMDIFMTTTPHPIPKGNIQLVACSSFLLSFSINRNVDLDTNVNEHSLAYMSAFTYKPEKVLDFTYEIFATLGYTIPRSRLTSEIIRLNRKCDLYVVRNKYADQFPHF